MCTSTAHVHLLQFLIYYIASSNAISIALRPNTPELINLSPRSHTTLSVSNITSTTSYGIFQAHSQFKNITLSLYRNITSETSETGHSVGVLIVVKEQTTLNVFIASHHNVTLVVLVVVTFAENALTPVPGGCNLEFNMENDPNFHLSYQSDITDVKFQWGSSSTKDDSCEKSAALTQMSYHFYVYYIGDNDLSQHALFDGVSKMTTVENIQENGKKLKEIKYSSSTLPLLKLPTYTEQGTIYNLIVQHGDKMAAYVPITTYSRNLGNYVNTAGKVLLTISGIVGLLLCFAGHRYFQTGIFLMSFCGMLVVFYLVLCSVTTQSLIVTIVVSCILATIAAVLWLMVWWCLGQSVLSVLVPGLTAGYLFACILFYTPFGNISYWSARYNYGMAFCVAVLILPVLLLYWTKVLNIISCAFIGSFLTTLTVDVWINSGLKYIVINTFRHACNSEYLHVVVTGPFNSKDIILTCVWAVLFIAGAVFQFYREKGRPDFPPCPRKMRQLRRLANNGLDPHDSSLQRQTEDDNDESSSLIKPGNRHNYTVIERELSEHP